MVGRVSAATVTWNSRGVVAGCLDSLLAEGAAVREIIVVDNASFDGTPEFIKETDHTLGIEAILGHIFKPIIIGLFFVFPTKFKG